MAVIAVSLTMIAVSVMMDAVSLTMDAVAAVTAVGAVKAVPAPPGPATGLVTLWQTPLTTFMWTTSWKGSVRSVSGLMMPWITG